jgi:hypothetical protein
VEYPSPVDGLTDRPRLAAVLIRALLIDPDGTMPPERFVVRIDMSSLGLPLPGRDEIDGRRRRQAPPQQNGSSVLTPYGTGSDGVG